MQATDKPAAPGVGARIAIIVFVSLALLAVCFFLQRVLGRFGSHFIPSEIFFPYSTIAFFLSAGTGAAAPALLGTLLVYAQFPVYVFVAVHGWAKQRARRILIGIAVIHFIAVLISVAMSLFMRWKSV